MSSHSRAQNFSPSTLADHARRMHMPRHGSRVIAALLVAVAAIACGDDTTSSTSGPTFMRMRLVVTNPGDTLYVRRYADCALFDSATVAGAYTQVAETLRVNVNAPATITAQLIDNLNNTDPVAQSANYKIVVVGLRSKVGTLAWNSTGDFTGTLTGSAVTNPPATNDSASIRIGLLDKTSGDTVYGHTCPVRVSVR
jgi:hypothetical protein